MEKNGDGRNIDPSESGISTGVMYSETRPSANDVDEGKGQAIMVDALAVVVENTHVGRMNAGGQESSLGDDACYVSSGLKALEKDSDDAYWRELRRVGRGVGVCERSSSCGDYDDEKNGDGDDGSEQVCLVWSRWICVQSLSEGGGGAMLQDVQHGLERQLQWATARYCDLALCFCLKNHAHVARALLGCLPWGKDINSSPTANAATETALDPARQLDDQAGLFLTQIRNDSESSNVMCACDMVQWGEGIAFQVEERGRLSSPVVNHQGRLLLKDALRSLWRSADG